MQSQTEDVIIMAHVETLRILLSVVHNPYSSNMVHYLPSLGIEQVAPAIIPPVAANKKGVGGEGALFNHYAWRDFSSWNSSNAGMVWDYAISEPTHEWSAALLHSLVLFLSSS